MDIRSRLEVGIINTLAKALAFLHKMSMRSASHMSHRLDTEEKEYEAHIEECDRRIESIIKHKEKECIAWAKRKEDLDKKKSALLGVGNMLKADSE